jgi:hypothetical protein
MMKKTLAVAALGLGLAAAPMMAQARDDRAVGALAGGVIGALIGSSVHGGDGAAVGGIFGALAGAALANDRHDHRRYRHEGRRYGYGGGHPGYADRGYRRHDPLPRSYTRAYNTYPRYAYHDGYRAAPGYRY